MIERLVTTYQQPLYRYLCRMLHNEEDAKDVLQNTWLQVYTHLGELRSESSERAYLYRVATNAAYQWMRHEQPLERLDDVDANILHAIQSEPELAPAHIILGKLQQLVLHLPPTQRAVFNLRYHEDLTYEEIASITQTTVGASKTNFSLATHKLRYWLTALAACVVLILGMDWFIQSMQDETAPTEYLYSSEAWSEFAEDDLFLE